MKEKTEKPPASKKVLAANVLAIRNKLGLSQEAFAAKIGFHRTYINKLEVGDVAPTLDTLDRLAEALLVSPAALIKPPKA